MGVPLRGCPRLVAYFKVMPSSESEVRVMANNLEIQEVFQTLNLPTQPAPGQKPQPIVLPKLIYFPISGATSPHKPS